MPGKSRSTRRQKRGTTVPKVSGVALGTVIAARRLDLASGRGSVVTVEIGKPRKPRGRDDYFCPYRIRGTGDEVVRAAYGADAIQSLQLVMHAIGSALAGRNDLRFFGNEDLGFPSPEDLFLLSELKKRKASSPQQR